MDSDQLAIRTAEVRFMRAFAYQELVLRHGGVILRINEDRVDDHNQRAKARSSEEDCWTFILDEYEKQPKSYRKNGQDRRQAALQRGLLMA